MLAPGTLFGLKHCFRGKDSENDWYKAVNVQLGDSLRYPLADIVEVGGVASDYTAYSDHCIYFMLFGKVCACIGKFESAGNMLYDDIVSRYTMLQKGIDSPFHQWLCDIAIPFSNGNSYT